MKQLLLMCAAVVAFGHAGAQTASGAAPAVNAKATARQCKDGTAPSGSGSRACRGHGGYAPTPAAGTARDSAPAQRAPTPAAADARPSAKPASPMAGGGSGKVWVNTATNVYHCEGNRWYGKTKAGAYMTEGEAKAKGARPDHGKACQ